MDLVRIEDLYAPNPFGVYRTPIDSPHSHPKFPLSMHGTPGTMTPLLATKPLAFYDSGFLSQARVINLKHITWSQNVLAILKITDPTKYYYRTVRNWGLFN